MEKVKKDLKKQTEKKGWEFIIYVLIFQLPFIFIDAYGGTYLVSAVALLYMLYSDWSEESQCKIKKNSDWIWLAIGLVIWVCIFVLCMKNMIGSGLTIDGMLLVPSYLSLVNYAVPIIWAVTNRKEESICLRLDKKVIKHLLFMCIPFLIVSLGNAWIYEKNPLYTNKYLFQMIFQFIFGAAIGEELMYRGFLYSAIKKVSNRYVGMIGSALLFVFVHSNLLLPMMKQFDFSILLNAIVVFFLGIVNCMIYDRSKSIVAPVLFHILFNGTLGNIFYFIINIS